MRARELKRLWAQLDRLTRCQRQELVAKLQAQTAASESIGLIESAGKPRNCPHCGGSRVVRNGQADGLQRYKCRACGKSFNALTATPLARLRHKGKWIEQARAMAEGLTVARAGEHLAVAASTAFRWRHRFLALPRGVKPALLGGIAEIDETYVLESFKGRRVTTRKPRKRGGHAAKRGLSREQIPCSWPATARARRPTTCSPAPARRLSGPCSSRYCPSTASSAPTAAALSARRSRTWGSSTIR
jgi:transposase-like protein